MYINFKRIAEMHSQELLDRIKRAMHVYLEVLENLDGKHTGRSGQIPIEHLRYPIPAGIVPFYYSYTGKQAEAAGISPREADYGSLFIYIEPKMLEQIQEVTKHPIPKRSRFSVEDSELTYPIASADELKDQIARKLLSGNIHQGTSYINFKRIAQTEWRTYTRDAQGNKVEVKVNQPAIKDANLKINFKRMAQIDLIFASNGHFTQWEEPIHDLPTKSKKAIFDYRSLGKNLPAELVVTIPEFPGLEVKTSVEDEKQLPILIGMLRDAIIEKVISHIKGSR